MRADIYFTSGLQYTIEGSIADETYAAILFAIQRGHSLKLSLDNGNDLLLNCSEVCLITRDLTP